MTTDLELHQPGQIATLRAQIDAVKDTIAPNCTDAELQLFTMACAKTGLDPFSKQVYAIKRGGRMTIQTGIDGFRAIADRAAARQGVMRGEEPTEWCDANGKWTTEWLSSDRPTAARYTVTKVNANGAVARFQATARFAAYTQGNNGLWGTMPEVMIAKCAEALALRKAFPNDLSGIYSAEEMDQAGPVDGIPALQGELAPPPTEPVPWDKERTDKFAEFCMARGLTALAVVRAAFPGRDLDADPLTSADVVPLANKAAEMAGGRLDAKTEGDLPAPEEGTDPDVVPPAPSGSAPTMGKDEARKRFFAILADRTPDLDKTNREAWRKDWIAEKYGVDSMAKLTVVQLIEAGDRLEAEVEALSGQVTLDDLIVDAEVVDEG